MINEKFKINNIKSKSLNDYKTNLIIEGGISTNKTHEEWLDDFIDWLESRGEIFGGVTDIYE